MRNITLKQLRAFAAVVRTGSVTGAAQQLHVSPPAVTLQMQLLQEQIGLPLVERSPAGTVTVTLDGQTINTQAIPSDQSDLYTYSFTYTATKDATGSTMSATVTDSVLYQTTKPSDPLTLTADTTQGNSPGP